jgi:hypothetical protein
MAMTAICQHWTSWRQTGQGQLAAIRAVANDSARAGAAPVWLVKVVSIGGNESEGRKDEEGCA